MAERTDGRPRAAADRIGHVLVLPDAEARFPERVASVLGRLPRARVMRVEGDEADAIARAFREACPGVELAPDRKTPSSVTGGKRFLVIGTVERERGAELFLDEKGMVCHCFYHVMVMNNGCTFDCQYCFLQRASHFGHEVTSHMRLNVNYEDIVDRMREVAGRRLEKGMATRFHTGTLMDWLNLEPVTAFAAFLVPRLADPAFEQSQVVMWTKDGDAGVLLDAARDHPHATRRILPGWSLNSEHVVDRYETHTAHLDQRLAGAVALARAGYDLTLRVDPLVPYPEWREDYGALVDTLMRTPGLRAAYIVFGSLRFDEQVLIDTARARFPGSALFRRDLPLEDGAKYRVPADQRREMYRFLIDRVRSHDPAQPVAVCMEDASMWRDLDLDPSTTCMRKPVFGPDDKVMPA